MAQIYDTGDTALDDGDAVIAQYFWSDLEEIVLNDYGAKIVKVIVEGLTAGSITGTLHIFSETNGSWANNTDFAGEAPAQAPCNTSGHIASIAVSTLGTISDTIRYFMNNDTSVVKKLYVAFYNTDATSGQFKVRILYESIALGA